MEEKSLRVYADKTFFTRITTTLSKMLIPTKLGLNAVAISMKRNSIIKNFESYTNASEDKKEAIEKKYEDSYSLYLEAIDKYIMDSIYKKVKNDTASEFEKDALSKYYNIIKLKDSEYLEYKYKKQQYLLDLDYESINSSGKEKLINKYKQFYISKIDSLYKGILKHYSVKLADNISSKEKDIIYEKIFITLEEYITNILPIKLEIDENEDYKKIIEEYNKFENYTVGKLDQNEIIEKRIVLIALSRSLFTHSLPLIVAEQCYIKLLKDVRSLIVDTKVIKKREKAYTLLIKLIEEYNVKLLSTKVYWDKPERREEHKKFWAKYKEIEEIKNKKESLKQKEILFIKSDLKQVYKNENKYYKIIKFYKDKLVTLDAMKQIKDNAKTLQGQYTGKGILCRN